MVGRCIGAGRGVLWCAGIVPCHHLLSVWVPHVVRGVGSSRRRVVRGIGLGPDESGLRLGVLGLCRGVV